MRIFVETIIGIIVISCFILALIMFAIATDTKQKQDQRITSRIGKSYIIKKDTVTLVNYKRDFYIGDNGIEYNLLFIEKLKPLK